MTLITAGTLLDLLQTKHSRDLFVAECKSGPTWFSDMRRLDAWVMRRSWANFMTWGYEIKVSRSDFLHDDKWPNYLKFCHQFYFVAPSGVIDPREVGDDAGLILASKTGTRLYTKKRAPVRQVQIPEDLYIYILMSRARICSVRLEAAIERGQPGTSIDYWREWLKDRDEGADLGSQVSDAIQKRVKAAERAKAEAEAKVEYYELFRKQLTEFGYDPDAPVSEWTLRQQFEEWRSGVPYELANVIEDMRQALNALESLAHKEES